LEDKLHWETVTPELQSVLHQFMKEPIFDQFRLVGGTALSLYLGHRASVDIDLFSDTDYGTIDFNSIDQYLQSQYPYVSKVGPGTVGMGRSFLIGNDADHTIKVDVYYTEPFVFPLKTIEGIRLASIEEIVAMKFDIVQRVARKKDFWDIHELLDHYSLKNMIELHQQRYPYSHDRDEIIKNITVFNKADDDLNPECFRGKHWEIIQVELVEVLEKSGLAQKLNHQKTNLLDKKPTAHQLIPKRRK